MNVVNWVCNYMSFGLCAVVMKIQSKAQCVLDAVICGCNHKWKRLSSLWRCSIQLDCSLFGLLHAQPAYSARLSVSPITCTFTLWVVISLLLAYLCVLGRGEVFAYPGRTPFILCSVGPSGQGIRMTHSFLVTERVPYTRQILDGRTPTVYLLVETVKGDPARSLRAWLHCIGVLWPPSC